jgi:CHASE2 domain-containing sensor protein
VVAILCFLRLGFFQTLELKLLDEHFRLKGRRIPAMPVRIVAIDDASLEKVGRWPWPRATQGRLISTVSNAGARVIGLDVILTEPEQSAEQRVADDQFVLDLQGAVQVGPVTIPTDVEGRMLLNFAGPDRSFPHYPAADVLSGAVPPATFKDAIVFIGATATGIFDLRVTPYSAVFPGVEIHANTVENILSQNFLRRPAWVEVTLFILILGFPWAWGGSWSGFARFPGASWRPGSWGASSVWRRASSSWPGCGSRCSTPWWPSRGRTSPSPSIGP